VGTTLYQLDAVRQRRDGRLVLDVPALAIQAGRIHTLVGPNGSGKTTLLTILAFLARPVSGTLRFGGEEVVWSGAALLRLRRQATLVHQSPYLFAGTVAENLAVGVAHRKLAPEHLRARVAGALEAIALAGYERRSARALSQGEAQRVALARALLLEPRVLLLDEPLASVDRTTYAVVEEVIKALPAAGHTVIMASHDPEQPRRLGSEVIALDEGALVPSRPASPNGAGAPVLDLMSAGDPHRRGTAAALAAACGGRRYPRMPTEG
jgi:tungstate transport system ATP-binding protein